VKKVGGRSSLDFCHPRESGDPVCHDAPPPDGEPHQGGLGG